MFFVLSGVSNLSAQSHIVKFEEIKTLQEKAPKPLLALIMTSWCKYCHAMKNTMTRDKKVATILKEKFYTVFLDATEDKNDILSAGRNFKHRSGLHELAKELATIKGQISYPTITILRTPSSDLFTSTMDSFRHKPMLYILKKSISELNFEIEFYPLY